MLRPQSLSNLTRIVVTLLGDSLIVCAAVVAIVLLRMNVDLPLTRAILPPGKFAFSVENLAIFAIAAVLALSLSGFYDFRASHRHRPTLFVALPLQMAIVAIAGTLFEITWPRTVFILVPFLEALGLTGWRVLSTRLWRRSGRSTVVIGEATTLAALPARLPDVVLLAGVVSLDEPVEHPLYLGTIGDRRALDEIAAAEEVIDLGEGDATERRLMLIERRGPRGFLCRPLTADALVVESEFGSLGEHLLIQVSMPGAYGVGAVVKRITDVAFGGFALLVASPVMLVIAALIAIDSRGPVLLRQRRTGLGGTTFSMWKFRTMFADNTSGALATDGDVRVTRVGRWLRRYRLDELPQMINVVSGTMSLVGPRPEMPERVESITRELPHFGLRHFVRPGIAGLAQISAEYDQPSSVKLTYDLQYLCSWTPAMDVAILVRAVVTVLSGRGV
ncbi:MAG: exopolysaccharide biosynthesis polyprenyl glycosylphosphotransferase [Thermoanaerobaculia bacterium]